MHWDYRRHLAVLACAVVAASQTAAAEPLRLHYSASWRLMHAGDVQLTLEPGSTDGDAGWQAHLLLETAGLAGALYNVHDDYSVRYDSRFCASESLYLLQQGGKRRRIAVTFQQPKGTASYLERDLKTEKIVNQKEIEVPACVHDEVAALALMRTRPLEPGQSVEIPVSNGKKFARVRVEAQAREEIKTPSGVYTAVRYEAFLYRDVIYRRKARLFFWLSDDERRLPVQIRVDLGFLLGTVTLKLEKEEPA